MERKTLESAIITHADGKEEKEYCPSMNLINKYLDEPSKFVRDMLIKGELCKKLGPLEDIEENNLQFPLAVLFKALNEGFYVREFVIEKPDTYKDLTIEEWAYLSQRPVKIGCCKYFRFNAWYNTIEVSKWGEEFEVWLEDYGKTWALTKGELKEELR